MTLPSSGPLASPSGAAAATRGVPTTKPATGTSWPQGTRRYPYGDLPRILNRSASHHGRLAVRLHVGADPDDLLQAAASAGTCVELLAKATLTQVTYSFLADKGDRDSILILSGHSTLADRPVTDVRTIPASAALAACKHLHKKLPWNPNDNWALDARNAALHMALVDTRQLRRAVVQMAQIASFLCAEMEWPTENFWGPAATHVVDLLDEAKTELERMVSAKVAAAKAQLEQLVGPLDASTRALVLASLSGRPTYSSDYDQRHECPICSQVGWLYCAVERGPVEFDMDEDDAHPFVLQTAYPLGFACPVCELHVEGEELACFEFPSEIELEPDWEPFEAFEPDEDILRGR